MSRSPELPQPRRGRPPAPPGVSRNNRLVTFVTNTELDQIKELAQNNKLALSATLHQLIVKGLAVPKATDRQQPLPKVLNHKE